MGRRGASPLRWHFLLVLIVSIGVGTSLYVVPSLSLLLWPYPVKPLASRFFASVFLAVAVAAALALRESKREHAEVLLVMGVSVFGFILLAGATDALSFTSGATAALLWSVLLSVLASGSAFFLLRDRGSAVPEEPAVPRWLRRHFLLHTLVVLFFSMQMLLTPAVARTFWPWSVSIPIMRGIGGLFTGVAIGTVWSFRQRSWDRVRLLLPVNVTFVTMVLLAVGIHWSVIAAESPGWHVTIPWLVLYVYTAAYPAYYLLRPPSEKPIPAGPPVRSS